jgi:serine/threonine protein kinase
MFSFFFAEVLMQILHGIAFLHYNMIIHRDIKGDNVCMSGFVARIIDFGMARSLIIDDPKADGDEMRKHHIDNMEDEEVDDQGGVTRFVSAAQRSAAQYSAPEALLSFGHYDSKVDVWALGCLLSELLYCCDKAQLQRNCTGSRFIERFLFRPAHSNDSALPSILAHAVAAADDLVDAPALYGTPHKIFSDRAWNSLVARGFIDPKHREAVNRSFAWSNLASKFPTPELPADEIPVFEHLRTLMMRMLAFDPDQRCSAADALSFLTGAVDHPVRVAGAVLQEFRTLQEMLDGFRVHVGTGRDSSRRDRCLRFIRHVDPDHPSHPSPLALLSD